MEELRNLKQIYSLAAGRFNQYEGKDFILPKIFKEQVTEINSNTITYNDYSAVIETKGNQNGVLNIYLPNQWFYIASYFTDFYNELQRYKKEALKVVPKERLKDLNGSSLTEQEESRLQSLSLTEQSKSYLRQFMTDYSWWSGAKTIDRGDFYVSPILNSARLVNASQSFVADLCAFLADKQRLVDVIIAGEEGRNPITPKELLRQKAAATFLKNVMRLTIEKDPDLNLLEKVGKYEKSPKQLKINGFPLGRDKRQLPTRNDDVEMTISWSYNAQEYVLYLEWTPEMMETMFFPVYNEAYKGLFRMEKDLNGDYVLYEVTDNIKAVKYFGERPIQKIFYGAPGTGKSNTIKCEVDQKGLPRVRTTFHPDSDYSTFVGAYKPIMKESTITKDGVTTKEEKIVYTFCPQAFTNAYVEAWQTEEDMYLIIEEINRGNCAQIFGDLFQLLDRKNGVSEYPVEADTDLQNYLSKALAETKRSDIPEDVKSGKTLMLPANLYIWATMNTSDQSLFPIDSAFKRRWDWQYIKIKEGKDENGNKLNWVIGVNVKDSNGEEKPLSWWDFIQKINEIIASMTSSADKQLGYFFCKADHDGKISAETFVSKVIFYLWNDVFKDYGFDDASLFRYTDKEGTERDLTFPDFYDEDGEKVDTERLADFLKKVMEWKANDKSNDDK